MKMMKKLFLVLGILLPFVVAVASRAIAQEIYVIEGAYNLPKALHLVNGVATETALSGNPGALPQGVAIDHATGKIYWVDATHTGAQVRSASADLTVQDSLYPGDASLHALYGIALDATNGVLYWTSSDLAGKPMLWKANLDGSARTAMDILPASYGLTTLRGLALDETAGVLYITSDGTGQILRYNIGSSTLDTLLSGLISPVGIAVDHAHNAVYWTQSIPAEGSVNKADLSNGSGATVLYGSLNVPNYLCVDGAHGMVYWTQLETGGADGMLLAGLANGGSSEPSELATNLHEPAGVVVTANYTYVDLNVTRHCVQFGTVVPGDSMVVPLTISNAADSAGLIDSLIIDVPSFHITNNRSVVVPAHGSVIIQLVYSPAETQIDGGTLTVYAGVRQYTVSLSGNAMPVGDGAAEVFAGIPHTNGSVAAPYTEIRASRTNGALIRSTLARATDGGTGYQITIRTGETGIADGDTIVFTEIATNCDTMVEQDCANTVIFHPGDGPPLVSRDIHAFVHHTQYISLLPGYNAVSWSMVPPDPSVGAVFAGPLSRGSVKVIFRYANDGSPNLRFDYYIPALGRFNPLQQTSNTEGYFVDVWPTANPDAFSVTGLPVCDHTPIYLNPGYNLVSYLAP